MVIDMLRWMMMIHMVIKVMMVTPSVRYSVVEPSQLVIRRPCDVILLLQGFS